MSDNYMLGFFIGAVGFFLPFIFMWWLCGKLDPAIKKTGTTIEDYLLRNGQSIEEVERMNRNATK